MNDGYSWLVNAAQSLPEISAPARNALLSPSFGTSSVYRSIVLSDIMTQSEREALVFACWERHKAVIDGAEGILVAVVRSRLPRPLARDFVTCMAARGVILRRRRIKSISAYIRVGSAPRSPLRAESFYGLVRQLARETRASPWAIKINNAFVGICLAYYAGRASYDEARMAWRSLERQDYRAVNRAARELGVSTRTNHVYALLLTGAVVALGGGFYCLSREYGTRISSEGA